jgi:trehalose synthase
VLPTVPVPDKRVADYVETAGEEAVERLQEAARPLRGLRVLQLNSTAFGGGVAELLTTHVALLNDLGIQTTWAVLQGSDEYFAVTKAVHNALQGHPVEWTPQMAATYWERIVANAAEVPSDHDVYLVHDPQPAALLRVLEEEGRRTGTWVWRCHIDLSTPHEPVWSFFEPLVNRYDAAIFTLAEFVRPGITGPRLAVIPPSIDPLSMKNRPISDETLREVLAAFGIDPERPIITQVSRFDPWKDPLGVIDAYRLVREEVPDLQLIMAGPLASDDPEGLVYLDLTEEHRAGDPDIHLLTNLQGVGDLEINAFQQAASVIVQKSLREGFGLVVAEGMWKRKPVVGGNVGGIRLQIEDGVTGFLVEDVEGCARRVAQLLGDPDLRERMGEAARERVRQRFLSLREIEDHLRLFSTLIGEARN